MAGADTGILELPYQASAAVTKKRFVMLTGDQTVARASVIGSRVLGVAQVSITDNSATGGRNEITDGKGTAVHIYGVIFVESGAAVARDVEVMTDTVGRAITFAAPGVGVTHVVVGKALKAAGAAGEFIPVLLTGGSGRQVTG